MHGHNLTNFEEKKPLASAAQQLVSHLELFFQEEIRGRTAQITEQTAYHLMGSDAHLLSFIQVTIVCVLHGYVVRFALMFDDASQ